MAAMSEATKLDRLAALLKGCPDEVFLQPHNVPDPDAIASCLGLQYLLERRGVASAIVYDREIEKANSLKILELFGADMVAAKDAHTLGTGDWAVLVDGQKGNANLTEVGMTFTSGATREAGPKKRRRAPAERARCRGSFRAL